MIDDKINSMKVARKFEKDFWDGEKNMDMEVINIYQIYKHLLLKGL